MRFVIRYKPASFFAGLANGPTYEVDVKHIVDPFPLSITSAIIPCEWQCAVHKTKKKKRAPSLELCELELS